MSKTLFILNDAPYGNERAYNGLRLMVLAVLALYLALPKLLPTRHARVA